MSKRNILELMSLSIAAIFSIIFVLFKTNNASVIISFLYFIPSAISIYMFYNFNKIKNCKSKILKIVLMSIFAILIIYNLIFLYLLITSMYNSGNDIFAKLNYIFSYIFFILLFTIFIFNFIENDNTIINSNMIIISSITISLIHIYFFLNPYLRNNVSDVWYSDYGSSIFIEQNYLYFSIMYIIIIINKFYNRLKNDN